MANRTLRRNQSGNATNDGAVSSTDGTEQADAGDSVTGVTDPDSSVDGNGNERESDTLSAGSIRIVEVVPEQLGDFIDNGGEGTSSGDGTRKRRGRKPGSKNGTKRATATETVEPFLMMAHQWASVLLKTPEIALSQMEAKQLSDSYSVFCKHHDVPVLSEKRMSEINLIATAFVIYGPRLVAIRNRSKRERVNSARNVTEFPQSTVHPN